MKERILGVFFVALQFLCASQAVAEIERDFSKMTDTQKGERVFSMHVKRILAEKCNGCHGDDAEKIKGGLDLRNLEGFLTGGETSDKVLVPGHADQSLLVTAIQWDDSDYEMPPKENDRLSEAQIVKVKNWINWGAPWPSDEIQREWQAFERSRERTDEGVLVKTIGGTSEGWTYRRYQDEAIWAFQPVGDPKVPDVRGDHSSQNPIDAFVRAKLDAAGHTPAPAADPRTLIRRVTYDLIGLPPKPEEIDQFIAASETDSEWAYKELIDRLLASPRYGERWAQHWLDVVRWADTGGFSNDFERSNAWRYRDYVIRSLNNDKPYNQFIREQLAGDEIDPSNPEMIVATGFLRAGPYDNNMIDDDVARQMWLDDLVNGVGQTFLGTAMRCCKCHDHKFDPLPTEDYYRMYAAFAGTYPVERKAEFLDEENLAGFDEDRAMIEELKAFAQERHDWHENKKEEAAKAWYAERGREYVPSNHRGGDAGGEKPPVTIGLNHVEEGRLKVRNQDVKIWTRRMERNEPMAQSVFNGYLKKAAARKLRIPAKQDQSWRPKNFILLGGNVRAEGDEVSPGVLSATGLPSVENVGEVEADGVRSRDDYALTEDLHGRRTEFANWVADPRNPLSTRTIVNRIWGYHFPRAIAGNPNNIGGKGALPTHPDLLNWLTARFVEDGWSLKSLHRRILTSKTYRSATSHPEMSQLRQIDPDNHLLAYFEPRRLTAEEVRDSMLQVTGELSLMMGGLPARPEINKEVAFQPRMIQFSLAPAWQPSRTPEQRNRRSIYCYRTRGMRDPFLQILNQADPNESCELRGDAAVSPQAFTLLNSDVTTDRSIAFALHLEAKSAVLDERIDRAFRLVLGRPATADETARLSEFYAVMVDHHRAHQPTLVEYPESITRSLVEEYSGEEFSYEEILPVFRNYVPDKKAIDVSVETRALADICLLLFNSNEFVYVY